MKRSLYRLRRLALDLRDVVIQDVADMNLLGKLVYGAGLAVGALLAGAVVLAVVLVVGTGALAWQAGRWAYQAAGWLVRTGLAWWRGRSTAAERQSIRQAHRQALKDITTASGRAEERMRWLAWRYRSKPQ